MTRRGFLRATTFGSVAALARPSLATPLVYGRRSEGRTAPVKAFELDEMTIAQLQAGMQSRRLTAVSLASKYLRRISEIDARGPALHAVIELNPDALAIARGLDRERAAKGLRG